MRPDVESASRRKSSYNPFAQSITFSYQLLINTRLFLVLAPGLLPLCPAYAAIIGTNTPAEPVTRERIGQLPKSERTAWQSYLERSSVQRRADQSFFREELKRNALSETTAPAESRGTRGIPLNREAQWYSSSESTRIADNLLSFQTPAGGWSKNLDMVSQPRKAGQRFALGNLSRFPGALDFDSPNDSNWNYVGTFDNDALGSDQPIFGDRDKTIHDRLDEISAKRRRGYGWYRDTPREVLARYPVWNAGLHDGHR